MKTADIDIDFQDPQQALQGLQHVRGTLLQSGERARHPTAVYFQNIPIDPLDGMAVWDHRRAAEQGYFKIDFCSGRRIYEGIRDEAHLETLINTPPPWALFQEEDIVNQLPHLEGHFDAVAKINPQSLDELAVCIALYRPGKAYLMRHSRSDIMRDIWLPTTETKYEFKRSHALAYALLIIVRLNLMVEEANAGASVC